MRHPTGYVCKECGKLAAVSVDGTISRTCDHNGTIYMLLDVEVTGVGVADDLSLGDRLLNTLSKIGSALLGSR